MAIPNTRRRESIFDNPIGSFRGVNSLTRFADSYSRSVNFHGNKIFESKLAGDRAYFDEDGEELVDPETFVPSRLGSKISTIFKPNLTSFGEFETGAGAGNGNGTGAGRTGSMYSFGSRLNPITSRTSLLSTGIKPPNDSTFLKTIEDSNGKNITVIAGESTLPQTVFNSVNIMIGIGLLALPLGLRHAGWMFGLPFLSLCAFSTFQTAELLSKCMDTDATLMTYADIGYAAFGVNARILISFLFSIDLLACGVSLIILFADSLNALFPSISVLRFKFVAFLILTPFTFMPLRVLSMFSLLGVMSTISVIITVISLGLTKSHAPGSLLEIMPTNIYPESFSGILISIGIILSPFGGHSIFPNLRVDMRHPQRFATNLKVTYAITFLADSTMAIIGFLMFGATVKDEVTKSILTTAGYPPFVYILISCFISLVPLSKTPLNALPIVSMLDLICDVNYNNFDLAKKSKFKVKFLRLFNRVLVNLAFVSISIVFPEFDRIIGVMGSSICFTVCLILPCLFYMKLCNTTIRERIICWIVITTSAILAVFGTYAAVAL
ncbi:hypothetical protein PACTADRAFT_46241 [Pachysolen tannophilus NRRL Y-2460]|uniref:Amino acid transporter transmembrane domain-containing protein n=1 Tax=Pachysolen tannophilus NRRL Y-2460 TaxID=669874 RepID=A0A1E4TPG3_PACTA|nr:hypothetical protein PACTADRAFT_46241 [Pachysolen tannophilus NRRL Y-2460]